MHESTEEIKSHDDQEDIAVGNGQNPDVIIIDELESDNTSIDRRITHGITKRCRNNRGKAIDTSTKDQKLFKKRTTLVPKED